MITRAIFKNLKGLSSIDIRLGRLTVLVGPNAVGKTTILDGLWLLGELARVAATASFDDVQGVLRGRHAASKLIRHGEKEASLTATLPVPFSSFLGQPEAQIGWALRVNDEHPIYIARRGDRSFIFPLKRGTAGFVKDRKVWEESVKHFEASFQTMFSFNLGSFNPLSKISQLRFEPSGLARPAVIEHGVTALSPDGSNLAAHLQYLHGLRDGALERIEEQVARVVPRFRRLRFKPTSIEREETEILKVNDQALGRKVLRQYPGVELSFEFTDGALVPAEHVSEGTLLTLGIFSAVFAPEQQGMLIDDLDRALHPAAQARVIAALRAALEAAPGLQIVATTHSPDLVDTCSPDEVRVMGFDDKGIPRLADLSQHPEAARWARPMRAGEFWGSVGEGWVAQIPAPEELPAKESPSEAHGEGQRG